MAGQLEEALDEAVARGARINAASRLRLYLKHLATDGAVFPPSQRVELISNIRCEVDEIVSALEHLRAQPEVPGWATLLERVQAGQPFAGPHHDKAREAQVELVMAGAMRSAGAEVQLQEPDARAVVEGHIVHFAAKKPNSGKNLGKMVRYGRSQLAKAGGFGVLFVDFNTLATEHGKAIEVADNDDAMARIAPGLRRSIERLGADVQRCIRENPAESKGVLAVVGIVRARFVAPAKDGTLEYGSMHRIVIDHVTPTLADIPLWFRRFADGFGQINQAPALPRPGT
jgi:hypothetical protein